MSRNTGKAVKLDPNAVKTRDYFMLALIQGATKAGVQKDRRKEADRKACRGRHRGED
jgi:hypothetical protein